MIFWAVPSHMFSPTTVPPHEIWEVGRNRGFPAGRGSGPAPGRSSACTRDRHREKLLPFTLLGVKVASLYPPDLVEWSSRESYEVWCVPPDRSALTNKSWIKTLRNKGGSVGRVHTNIHGHMFVHSCFWFSLSENIFVEDPLVAV